MLFSTSFLTLALFLCLSYHVTESVPVKIDFTQADIQDYVDRHNALRASRCVAPLAWSVYLASTADWWASQCNDFHSNSTERKNRYVSALLAASLTLPSDTSVGENLASRWSSAPTAPFVDMQGWSDERSDWNCQTGTCASGRDCGHYTQQVWENTTFLGCAKYQCDINTPSGYGNPWYYLVCHYTVFQKSGVRPFPTSGCSCTNAPTSSPTPAPTSLGGTAAPTNSGDLNTPFSFATCLVMIVCTALFIIFI